jgi:membrane protein
MIFKARSYQLFKNTVNNLINHDGVEIAGYLAFLMLISIFPCTIFVAKVIGGINALFSAEFGEDAFLKKILESFDSLKSLPIQKLKPEIKSVLSGPPNIFINFAVLGILWTSSSIVQGLKTVMDRSYNVENKVNYVFSRLNSIIQFIFISFIAISLIVIIELLPIFFKYLSDKTKYLEPSKIVQYFQTYGSIIQAISLLIYTIFIHIIVTNAKLRIIDVFPGAIITVISWMVGTQILVIYFNKFIQFDVIYGSLANIISILIYFYVIFICLIFGAEFNSELKRFKEQPV